MIKLFPLISAAILLTLCGCSRQMNFDERCQKEAEMQTKKVCPKVITPGITLDSITFDTKQRTMQYHYTMEGGYDDTATIAKGKNDFVKALGNQIKNSIELKKYKDNGIAFRYTYTSKSTKKILIDESFTSKDYTQ